MPENKKKPDAMDVYVGSRVRLRRTLLGMSQEKLGEILGITFQQIQKYEKGTNRIGASRLHATASALGVPIPFLYDGFAGALGAGPAHLAEPEAPEYVADLFSTPEVQQLVKAFVKIPDPKVRRRIVDLVRSLTESPGEDERPG